MTKKINSLQSLRFFAALGVFQYHLWTNFLGIPIVHPGTDFFVVLVGMIAAVTQSRYISQGLWGQYIWRRYLRLYVTFIPVFVVYLIAGRDPITPEFALKSFFFIPIEGAAPLVGPTWMISHFLLFYWLFSLAFLFRNERVLIPVFGLWAVACLAHEGFETLFAHSQWGEVLFGIRNLEFIFGYAGGKVLITRPMEIKAATWTLALGTAILIAATVWFNTAEQSTMWRTFLFGPSLACISVGLGSLEKQRLENRLLRVMTHPWLVWLGGTSYVLFLIHNLVLRVWDRVNPITPLQIPLIVVVVTAVAALVYQFWEKPVLEFLRNKTAPRIPASQIAFNNPELDGRLQRVLPHPPEVENR